MFKSSNIDKKLEKLPIGQYKKHIFICTSTKCDPSGQGVRTWNFLKNRLTELGLDGKIFRSQVGCLRICSDGPIALVYPEGTWYAEVDETRCEDIIQKHLIQGQPIKEYMFAENPLYLEK